MTDLMTMATRAVGRTKLFLVKFAPQIMTYGGIIVTGIGIYMFCKATMHLDETLDNHDECMDLIEHNKLSGEYTEKEIRKQVFNEKKDFVINLAKLYGPAFTTTMFGFALILGGHHLINKRYGALGAAYKALEEGYSQYRRRVREDLGEEADRKYLYGLHEEQKDIIVKDQNGNERLISADVMVPTIGVNCSPYARFFDEYSTQWTRNPEYNLMFLNAQQNYANDKLHAQGHLFLNEVYEMLGLPHTQAGAVVGWVLNHGGDNCVDFGIYDLHSQIKRAFVNGFEPSILLDFNVDGPIYNLI